MTFLITAIKILILILCIAVALLYFFQHKLIFFPSLLDENHRFQFTVPFEEKFIKYGNNKTIHGLLFRPANAKVRILYFHGNGGALDSWGELAAELAVKLNAEVLMMDYPGYGKSGRDLPNSEKELLVSAQAALDEMNKAETSALPLVIYGRSLGSGVASYLAAHNKSAGLILETPYLSIKAMAAKMFPFIPSFFVRYELDNAANIKNLQIPVLILHGTADAVVPYEHGKALSQLNSNVTFVTVPGGTHNDLQLYDEYWVAIENLLVNFSGKAPL